MACLITQRVRPGTHSQAPSQSLHFLSAVLGIGDHGYEVGMESVGTRTLQTKWVTSGSREAKLESTQDVVASDNWRMGRLQGISCPVPSPSEVF